MSDVMTAEEFAACRFDLPDGGRWTELVAGRVVRLSGPDEMHGTVVLNLSKLLAAHLGRLDPTQVGSLCFDIGLVVGRRPDTVRFPSVSYFTGPERISEFDEPVTTTLPALAVCMASTRDRRRALTESVRELLEAGVETVWIIDTAERQAHVRQSGFFGEPRLLNLDHATQKQKPSFEEIAERLLGEPFLPGLSVPIPDLFAEPSWWRS